MLSTRCKMVVMAELEKLGISFGNVELGTIELAEPLDPIKDEQLRQNLLAAGLELLDDKKAILIERIRNVIIEMVHHSDTQPKFTFSEYLSEKLSYDYTYLSNIFSEVKGITIQQYIIIHKIERVKELLIYGEMSLTEIARKTGYSSVGHLSNQFKKITGLSPSSFKKLKPSRIQNLESL